MSNNVQITKKEYSSKSLKNVWGGSRVEVVYNIETLSDRQTNKYVVTCEVAGLHDSFAELRIIKCIALTNNGETLVADSLAGYLNWECSSSCETETFETEAEALEAAIR